MLLRTAGRLGRRLLYTQVSAGFDSLAVYMTLIKKTTVREFDAECRVIKETVTEEYAVEKPVTLPNPWPTQPLISHGDKANPHPYTVNVLPCDMTVRIAGNIKSAADLFASRIADAQTSN